MAPDLTALMQSVHELNSHAKEHFDDKEYAEALPYLLESYRRLIEFRYSPHSDEVTPMVEYMYWMAWVCYRIAICYVEEDDYVSAYYYIDLVSRVNPSCFMEWINILVNSRRMDALGVVETYVEDPEMLDPICDEESEKKTIMDFLERRLRVSYTKRILFRDMSVNIRIGIEEVKSDSVLLSYDVAFGLDSLISGALSFIKGQFPELSAGIHPEDGHRIRINLSEIEKAKPVVENIALRAITPCEDGIRIEFGLKVP